MCRTEVLVKSGELSYGASFYSPYTVSLPTSVIMQRSNDDLEFPSIKNFKIENEKTLIVYFSDGTKTVSICDEEDTFDLDIGIMICVFKKLFGNNVFSKVRKEEKKVFSENLRKYEEQAKQLIEKINEEERAKKRAEKRFKKRVEKEARFQAEVEKRKKELRGE